MVITVKAGKKTYNLMEKDTFNVVLEQPLSGVTTIISARFKYGKNESLTVYLTRKNKPYAGDFFKEK